MNLLAEVPRPESVCLEISEQEFIGSCEGIREGISAARDMGFLIGLDDIGFGRTSLESLIAIDPEIAKIDRSLITGISEDDGLRRSLSRLVYMLSGSHSTIVAEGVESDADRKVLEDMGIEYAQGYLWSLPED